jgi:heme-degrading monooxygenase HmoA
MAAILYVRAKSQLDEKELERRLLERRPRFHDVPGLVQKLYGRDEATGAVCGVYFFETQAALDAFTKTELAKSIPTAYEVSEIRREVYDVLYPLRPERGPFVE